MDSTPVRIEELLAHASWVRALAGRLVRDPATADDIAQDVWTSALRSAPHERANIRGWLAAAVRNAARSLRRGEQRREIREHAASAPSAQLGPAELVERAQLHRELVEQVLSLEESQRSMVLAHWFEGLSVAEAGRRLHLTERVARMRLESAHKVLRKRLDRRPGGREAWSVAFLEWSRPQLAAAGSGGALVLGGIAVATKFVVSGVAACVLAVFAWMLWPREVATQQREESAAAVASDSRSSATEDVAAPSARDDSRTALTKAPSNVTSSPPPDLKPRWIVRGRVSGGPAGSLERTSVSAVFVGASAIPDGGETKAASDGTYEIDLTAAVEKWQPTNPIELLVTAVHPLSLRSESRELFTGAIVEPRDEVVPTNVFTCDVTLSIAAVVTGRIVLPLESKEPVARVELGLYESPASVIAGERGVDYALCDSAGNFALRANHAGEYTVIAQARNLRPEARETSLTLGRSTDLGAIQLARSAKIAGTVWRAGRSIGPGARVVASASGGASPRIYWTASSGFGSGWLERSGAGYRRGEVAATTDSAGRFMFEGLDDAEYALRVDSIPGVRRSLGGRVRNERVVHAPSEGVDLSDLPPLLRLSLTVNGRPPNAGELDFLGASLLPKALDAYPTPLGMSPWPDDYVVGVPSGIDYEFHLDTGRFEAASVLIPALALSEERDFRLDLKLRPAASALVIRLVSNPPREVRKAEFLLVNAAGVAEGDWRAIECASDGKFRLEHLAAGRYRIRERTPDAWQGAALTPYLGTELDIELQEGKTLECELHRELGSRLRLSAKDERGGFARAAVELRDARGEKLETQFYCMTAGTMFGCGWYLCEQGINDHPPLPSGHYELTLTADGFEPARTSFDLIQGETLTLDVPMRRR